MKKIFVSLLLVNFSFVIKSQTASIGVIKKLSDPVIFMVTCNESGTENKVRWIPEIMPEAETIIIFRINKTGDTIEIGQQAAKDSVFIDQSFKKLNKVDASYKYLIQYKDKSGNLSTQSRPHQTIFVSGNQKGQFTWNAYEIAPRDSNGKIMYHLWRQAKSQKVEVLPPTEETSATDPKFEDYKGTDTIWWVELGGFDYESRKTGTKSNNSNE
jgi:hypothetical protein